jgi:predicted ferric reductase
MLSIVALGILSWTYREFFYRWLAPQADYEVVEAINKGAGVVEVVLKPLNTPLKYAAGQFAYFSFRGAAVSAEPHPFSISSKPSDSLLRFAAKNLGDFTKTLTNVRPGDKAKVYGPHGKFFAEMDPAAENIFIAGGIGVTPFLSILRGERLPQTMAIYTTRTENDCVFADELFRLSSNPGAFKYFFHESDRRGNINAEIVEKRAGGLKNKKIFLCGPAPMMKSLAAAFLEKGVSKNNIIFEQFSY